MPVWRAAPLLQPALAVDRVGDIFKPGNRATILLVDDDEVVRHALRTLLRRSGFCALTCANGAEAIAMLRGVDIDVVVTDLDMPEVDGHSLIEWIRRHRPHLPTVVLTGHHDDELRSHTLGRGVVEHLEKPLDPSDLVELLNACEQHAGLAGDLRDLEMLEYLTAVVRGRRSVTIEIVTADQTSGAIYVDQGRITHAEIGDEQGESAFVRCARQQEGTHASLPWRAPARRTIWGSSEALLLRAARIIVDS